MKSKLHPLWISSTPTYFHVSISPQHSCHKTHSVSCLHLLPLVARLLTDLAAFHSSSCHSPLYAPLLSAVSCVAINLLLLFHCNMKRELRLCLSSCHTSIWNKTVDWVNTRKRYCQHFLNIFCASTLSTDRSIFLSKELKITKQWSKADTYWQTNH